MGLEASCSWVQSCSHRFLRTRFSRLCPLWHLIKWQRKGDSAGIESFTVFVLCEHARTYMCEYVWKVSLKSQESAMFAYHGYNQLLYLNGRIDKRLLVVLTVFPCLFSLRWRLRSAWRERTVINFSIEDHPALLSLYPGIERRSNLSLGWKAWESLLKLARHLAKGECVSRTFLLSLA